ncbi:MAG: hypothetical protein A2Z18_00565 [Armatimonadetes bacterium RBG_16_58_9]|nr:MAG: hypothetical protein A2Z18_00565 [Armatimonadetes bacterium RBG_16_58_9]
MNTRSLLVGLILSVVTAVPCFGADYVIIDLGNLPGGRSTRVDGLNELGQVVGGGWPDPPAGYHAFVWDPITGMEDLGRIYGSNRVAVNNRGQVAGTNAVHHAFVWSAETGMIDLGTLNGGQSWGYEITDDGHVFGVSIDSDRDIRVFEWAPETGMRDLGLDDVVGPDTPMRVNNAHQIAGMIGGLGHAVG